MTITIVKNLRICEDCLITLELYDNSDQRICAHKEDPAVENIQDLVTPNNVAIPANQDVTMPIEENAEEKYQEVDAGQNVIVALLHLPCYGLFALIVQAKYYFLSRWLPQ
ncbi:hypothetical protein POM88_025368 [Heracleum sosnowskyi]|uniref:Uncharacterized protein n=1 Tax=Heracleum sosnowskyi TaxID=360622 RepID=A0AAD8I3U8_9APIA|nr:hypothetical protein POM88_025368 [Heracleum sosnowskyi]